MINRKDKTLELMEIFRDLHKSSKFKLMGHKNCPPVTLAQWGVLAILQQNQSASVKEIAKGLNITSSAATQLTDGLVKKGFVLRTQNKDDRRKLTLTLSEKTRKQVEQMHAESVNIFTKLFDSLSDKEFEQFFNLHVKVLKGINK